MDSFKHYFARNMVNWLPDFPEVPDTIVVIPVYNDPDIFQTLDSLCHCDMSTGKAGVVIVVNHPADCCLESKEDNRRLAFELEKYIGNIHKERLYFSLMKAFDLPVKQAGVGLARKLGMDASAAYFYRHQKPDYPIISLDADTWVESRYFDEVIRFFRVNPVAGASIGYEHRLNDPGCVGGMREAMVKYELYLRYYRAALEYTGHPHAFHCIGSAFAVRTVDYVAQGGMNKRQAGEDFYFLQKLITTGRYALLDSTRVYPSPRFSTRTPFGTGQSVQQIVAAGGTYPVYCFEAFLLLKKFFAEIPGLYHCGAERVSECLDARPEVLRDFLTETGFELMVREVNGNCATQQQFARRFFHNFNAFQVLKFLNFAHQSHWRKVDITEAVALLLETLGVPVKDSPEELLFLMRARG